MGFMKWGCKFVQDPVDPRFSMPVGKFDEDFLAWVKLIGRPTWFQGGRQGIFTNQIWIRDPQATVEKPKEGEEMGSIELLDEGVGTKFFIPLEVLEPIFNRVMKKKYVALINPHTGMEMPLTF